MQKLNELVELAQKADTVGNLMDSVNPNTILAIAEEFWALEQRAEAAEARANNLNDGWLNAVAERDEAREKLAELENQEPLGFMHKMVWSDFEEAVCTGGERGREMFEGLRNHFPVYAHPAPAVSLVIPADGLPDNSQESQDYRTGFAMGCACYAKRIVELNPNLLRKIEEEECQMTE